MVRVSMDRFTSSFASHDYLHKSLAALHSFKFRPSFFGRFFRETDQFINNNLRKRPEEIHSMFPSLFDGIRLGSHHTTLQLRHRDGRDQHRSSDFRIIPVKVVHGSDEKQSKSKHLNHGNPIVVDDDDVEMIDITGESTSHSTPAKCVQQRNLSKPYSAIITVDDDSLVHPLRQSSAMGCTEGEKSSLRKSSLVKSGSSPASRSTKASQHNSSTEKHHQSSDGKMLQDDHMKPDSCIILDDDVCDQDSTDVDTGLDSELPLQHLPVRCPAMALNENIKMDLAANALESELKSNLSISCEADNLNVDNTDLIMLHTENKDDIQLLDAVITRDQDFSGAKAFADCHAVDLMNSPPPIYPVYSELTRVLARENRKIHYITGDGNCFFRALCTIYFGSEYYHKAARALITNFITTNASKFAQFVDEQNVQDHVQKMSQDHCWATTCEIYAAATLLQRDIYVFTPNHLTTHYSWLLFKPVFKTTSVPTSFARHTCYITLCNTNGNHYDLVVADHGKCNCFLPHPELGGISACVDLT